LNGKFTDFQQLFNKYADQVTGDSKKIFEKIRIIKVVPVAQLTKNSGKNSKTR
jgi:hypothetical protein